MFKIKEVRESKGLGVNELSRMSGVNASYISALERGEKQNPTINTLKKLADTLEVTIDELICKAADEEKIKEWDDKYNNLDNQLKMIKGVLKELDPNINNTNEFASELHTIIKMLSPKYKN